RPSSPTASARGTRSARAITSSTVRRTASGMGPGGGATGAPALRAEGGLTHGGDGEPDPRAEGRVEELRRGAGAVQGRLRGAPRRGDGARRRQRRRQVDADQ